MDLNLTEESVRYNQRSLSITIQKCVLFSFTIINFKIQDKRAYVGRRAQLFMCGDHRLKPTLARTPFIYLLYEERSDKKNASYRVSQKDTETCIPCVNRALTVESVMLYPTTAHIHT